MYSLVFAASSSGVWTWIGVAGVAILALYFLNRTAFRRTADAAGAQAGKLGRTIWGFDPIAVKNAEIDRKAEDLAEATRGLEQCRGLINGVERQVKSGTAESNRLRALAQQHVKEGNDDKAKEKLLEKTRVDKELADNQEQLKVHRESYDAYLMKIQNASKRIAELRREARQQGVRLQMAKAEANLSNLGTVMGKANVNFDSLAEVDEEIENQIDQNRAKGQVAHDLAKEGLEEIEAENRARSAEADSALASLKAEMNGSLAVHDPHK